MWWWIVMGALAVLAVVAVLVSGHSPRDADRGGFEQHPGTGGPFSGGGPLQ